MHQILSSRRLVIILILAAVAGLALIYFVVLKKPLPSLQRGPKVELKTTYKNPFDKNTQYVNPFDKYKNPFVTNR
ncbi:MAG: hypothetical protein HY427_02985 [Candidatus Levybacteria bacterium]|nr:hypothetical protein [Candidatus Levybacteria bacterium]